MQKIVLENAQRNMDNVLLALKATGLWASDEVYTYVRTHLPFLRDLVDTSSTTDLEQHEYLYILALSGCPVTSWRNPIRRHGIAKATILNLKGKDGVHHS